MFILSNMVTVLANTRNAKRIEDKDFQEALDFFKDINVKRPPRTLSHQPPTQKHNNTHFQHNCTQPHMPHHRHTHHKHTCSEFVFFFEDVDRILKRQRMRQIKQQLRNKRGRRSIFPPLRRLLVAVLPLTAHLLPHWATQPAHGGGWGDH